MTIRKFLLSLFLLGSVTNVFAQEKLLFSGFAFSGNYENRESLYPFSSRLANERINGQPILDKVFMDRIRKNPEAMKRITTDLSRLGKSGSQISLAFALNLEDVEYQELDGKLLVILRLYSTVLAFDRDSNTLVATYPVRIRYSTIAQHKPDQSALLAMFRSLYISDELNVNAFDVWISRFNNITIKSKYSKYLQVKSVEFETEAKQLIPQSGKTEKALRNQIANALETAISNSNNIPIVPSSAGEAVGSKMAYRFSDGNSLQLNLPSPDYEISFAIRAFRGKSIEQGVSTQDIYRVLANIKIEQPDLNKVYLDEKIYNTLIVNKPKSSKLVLDAWHQYYKTLIELISDLSTQFSRVDGKWLENSASRGVAASDAFEGAVKFFNDLR